MQKVTGIGGFFFRAKNPDTLAQWYLENLGVNPVPQDYDEPGWETAAGPTVFAPFSQDTNYFGRMDQQWMMNFRVADMDAMVEQLRDNGNVVDVDAETYPNGRFALTHDPEGNPIQLWEPGGVDA